MELVPIIQRVLTIVAILATATLIISYIAFKIRQKHRPEQVYVKNNADHLEPSFVGKSIRRITRITKEILPLNTPVQQKREQKPPKQEHHRAPKRQQPMPEKRKAEQKPEYSQSRRIEVVNNFPDQNINSPTQQKSKKIDSAVNSLGDDILNKYSDNESQDLYLLKTNKKNTKE